MSMKLPFSACRRRILLDFHNPAGMPDIGADFDAAAFGETLVGAGCDGIVICAYDSHGHAYFPARAGRRHPGLARDLVGEMITAAHARDIGVATYLSAGCSDYAPPEWLQVGTDGAPRTFLDQGGYASVCLNSPYPDEVVLPIAAEVLRGYPVDALWFDLLFFWDEGCWCAHCLAKMRAAGLDPCDPRAMRRHMNASIGAFVRKVRALTDGIAPGMEMAFNGHSVHERPDGLDDAAYVEIEALATGGWGYGYFPAKARYLRTLGKPVAGLTAAFHDNWGDFGSVKSRALLEQECYTFLAAGSAVGIGDQLPPRGRLEPARYARIGEVLNPIAALDPWLRDAEPLAEAAILLYPLAQGQFPGDSWAAACKLLMEAKVQFDTVDADADWRRYRLLVLPDRAYDADIAAKLAAYLQAGGAVLATGDALDVLPPGIFTVVGDDAGEPAYLRVQGNWAGDVPDLPHVVKSGFRRLHAPGVEVLATRVEPYPRVGEKCFYSSAQMPYLAESDVPVIAQAGRLIYIAAPLFREYGARGYGVLRQLLAGAVRRLLPHPLTCGNLPLAWEQAALARERQRIQVIVPYSPVRDERVAQIEEWPALANLTVGMAGRFARACLAPDGAALPIRYDDGYTLAALPPHAGPMVVVFD